MRILGIGFAVLAVLALMFVWSVSDQFHRVTWLGYANFYFTVLFAPVALIWFEGAREAGRVNVVLCLVALLGTGVSPFLRGRTRMMVSIIAFSLWAYFELLVAGSVV